MCNSVGIVKIVIYLCLFLFNDLLLCVLLVKFAIVTFVESLSADTIHQSLCLSICLSVCLIVFV